MCVLSKPLRNIVFYQTKKKTKKVKYLKPFIGISPLSQIKKNLRAQYSTPYLWCV